MAITNGYCTLAEFYERYGTISAADADTARDAKIEDHIEAASRWIDNETGRQFFASTDTRYFTAESSTRLKVSDLLSVTTLKTDEDGDRTYEVTWETTDYDLMPFNYTPYQWLEVTPNGDYYFPLVRGGVEIAGSWGYTSTTPPAIKEACLLQASRLYMREKAVLGVAGTTSLGTQTVKTPKDEDIRALIKAYIKRW